MLLTAAATRDDFAVSTATSENQFAPQVAVAPNGDFVVAWYGEATDLVYSVPVHHANPYFRRYSANGLAKDAGQVAVSTSLDYEYGADVAVDASGNFVVVWVDRNSAGDEDVLFQRYNSLGVAQGAATKVNTTTTGTTIHKDPRVAMAAGGDFVVVWEHQLDAGKWDVYYRRYYADGTPKDLSDAPVRVSANSKYDADVSIDASGSFVVAWTEVIAGDADVFFKVYRPDGTVRVSQTQANQIDGGRNQSSPSVAMDARGYFTIAWHDDFAPGDGDIYLQQFDDSGARRMPADFPVVTSGADQILPRVSACATQLVVGYLEQVGEDYESMFRLYGDDTLAHGSARDFHSGFSVAVPSVAMNDVGEFAVAVEHPTSTKSLIQGVNYRNDDATPGLFDPATLTYYLRNSNTPGIADSTFRFAAASPGWVAIAGDWDGDGTATTGLYDPTNGRFYLTNSNTVPVASIQFSFGAANAGWIPIAGDWNHDGIDTIGLFDPTASRFYLKNSNTGGFADETFDYGPPSAAWTPVAGDWNHDLTDTIGLYDPANSRFYLRNSNTAGPANITFDFGPASAGFLPITGDWDYDGTDTIGLFDPAYSRFFLKDSNSGGYADAVFVFGPALAGWTPIDNHWNPLAPDTIGLFDPNHARFYLRNSNAGGYADATFECGPATSTWLPLVGDWNGDGAVTIGLYDPANFRFHLRNTNTAGVADLSFRLLGSNPGSLPISGDWDGDGIDTIGLYDPTTSAFYLSNSNTEWFPNLAFTFGVAGAGWKPLAGDWDKDGVDTIGLYNPAAGAFYLRNSNSGGYADIQFRYGPAAAGWLPLAGDWTRSGTDTLGLVDPAASTFYLRNANAPGYADTTFNYGPPGTGWLPLAGDWNGPGAASLRAAADQPIPLANAAPLAQSDLKPIVEQALSQWAGLGLPSELLNSMARVEFVIADLPGTELARTDRDVIYVDRDAAGHGWFLQPAPALDGQFGQVGTQQPLWITDPRAVDQIDLLTVVAHELGHVAGLGDLDSSADGLMSGTLAAGVRRVAGAAEVDAVFS